MNFPADFVWGAATASYQIEGGGLEDGRGECIWYRFAHTPGKVRNGDTGDVACDHYHRYREDVQLMRQLGLDAYRFSISWPRVLPTGVGATNPAGLDFYDRLVDELLAVDIQPYVTLYHWDLPQALQDQGGWENPQSVQWFADYAGLMAERLGDRVKQWITLNEPWVVAFLGNYMGEHAPGKHDLQASYQIAHHLMLAHNQAVPVIRARVPDAQVGITLNLHYYQPATDSEADRQAARRQEAFLNSWFLDATFKGAYPADLLDWLGDELAGVNLDGLAVVPIDFLGVNYYTRHTVAQADTDVFQSASIQRDHDRYTEMGWEIYPEGLREILLQVHREYAPPAIYITENGAAFPDPAPVNGVVEDPQRVDYLKGHFEACSQAIAQGVPLKGYFVWSLLDNFEWAFGYSRRFGIVHVDFATQQRTLKRSALYLQSLAQS
jgi:beta-glucosidase